MRIEWMNAEIPAAEEGMSRRTFMKAAGVAGGGLVLGFFVPGANKFAHAQAAKPVYAPTLSCISRPTTP